jgi:hypothetical protein
VGDDEKRKKEEASHSANHLVEEHLELLFKIRQQQDDHMHCQSIISQIMDILFKAAHRCSNASLVAQLADTKIHPSLYHPWTTKFHHGLKQFTPSHNFLFISVITSVV